MKRLGFLMCLMALFSVLSVTSEAKITGIAFDQESHFHDLGFFSDTTDIGYEGVDIELDFLEDLQLSVMIHSVDKSNQYHGNVFIGLFLDPDDYTETLKGNRYMIGISSRTELIDNVDVYKSFHIGYETIDFTQSGERRDQEVSFSGSTESYILRLKGGMHIKNIFFFENIYIRPYFSLNYKFGSIDAGDNEHLVEYNPHDKLVFGSGIQFGLTF